MNDVSKVVKQAIEKGYQISPGAIKLLQSLYEKPESKTFDMNSLVNLVIEEKSKRSLHTGYEVLTINEEDFVRTYPEFFESRTQIADEVTKDSDLQVMKDPEIVETKEEIEGFLYLFKSRYEKILKIFRDRPDSTRLQKISEVSFGKGSTKVCGLVLAKRVSKTSIELTIDDSSGKISAPVISEESKKVLNQVGIDQCVLVNLENRKGRVVITSVTQPDLPIRVVSSSRKLAYAIFLSDLHIGSKKFLETAFDRFLNWINGIEIRSEIDEDILRHLEYIVIAGDIVDGVGVFPNQEFELVESDVVKQYNMAAKKLAAIPKSIKIITVPGNHDSTRQALPQPKVPQKYAGALYSLENVLMLGDPCVVKLRGVKFLVYHGRSLDDVVATTPGLSYERPSDAMKVLLKARHLAPSFGLRTPIAPELEDRLVIEDPPDVFHAGHVHTLGVDSYKGTLVINSGTWQGQTSYQANLGIMPTPGVVPVMNLATSEIVIKQFLTSD